MIGKLKTGGSRDTNYGTSVSEYVHVRYRWSVGKDDYDYNDEIRIMHECNYHHKIHPITSRPHRSV